MLRNFLRTFFPALPACFGILALSAGTWARREFAKCFQPIWSVKFALYYLDALEIENILDFLSKKKGLCQNRNWHSPLSVKTIMKFARSIGSLMAFLA